MKRIVIFVTVIGIILSLCSCGAEKVEGDALQKYLEIIDSLEAGTVEITTAASSSRATVMFRQGEKGCEILSVTKNKNFTYKNYFDGVTLYSGEDTLEAYDASELEAITVKRSLIGAPDYAIDENYYDIARSGIYKTLTGYKIVIVTHDVEDDFTDSPDTILTVHLDSDMIPKKAVIEDEIFEVNGGTTVYKTTLTYKNIGIAPIFEIPTIA